MTVKGVAKSRSIVRVTVPWVLFSTGTTANCTVPDSTAWKVASIVWHGLRSTEEPNCSSTAISVKVPWGPK